MSFCFFFFNDTATTEIYTLSLHDALPISWPGNVRELQNVIEHAVVLLEPGAEVRPEDIPFIVTAATDPRSEEHTSELQSQSNLVCRLLLEKKKKNKN